ncbi:MAG: SHOCT domain-containing protein [Gammaproteobacteria bacterium]|jgi:hypothetical protein
MNLNNKSLIGPLLIMLGLFAVQPRAWADKMLWQSGRNLYIKLVDQEGGAKPNDQPVTLDVRKVANALKSLHIRGKYAKGGEPKMVFSAGQAQLLGQYLAKGLQKARPDQDIVFALARQHLGFLNESTSYYLAGRAFYVDGKLNVIIGTYNRAEDKFKERTSQSMGAGEVKYYFDNGSRGSKSGFKKPVIISNGVSTHPGRKDWLELNVDEASKAYLAQQRQQPAEEAQAGKPASSGNNAALQQQLEEMAQERREMRVELARMRKEMKESSKGSRTVEERLKTLDSLKQKGLISDEEYKQKRKEILNDL